MNHINQWGYNTLGLPSEIPVNYCSVPLLLETIVNGINVKFKWVSPHDYMAYRLRYKKVGDTNYTIELVYGTSKIITLLPATEYIWNVATVCDLGTNRQSNFISGTNFTTAEPIHALTPVDASTIVIVTTDTTAHIGWSDTGALLFYVNYRIKGGLFKDFYTEEAGFNHYELEGLSEGVAYEICVTAVYTNGYAENSGLVVCKTLIYGCGGVMEIVKAVSKTNAIALNWNPTLNDISYNVVLNDVVIAQNLTSLNYTIVNLQSDTEYKIGLITNCIKGRSKGISVLKRTLVGNCLQPTNISAALNADVVTITWNKFVGCTAQKITVNGDVTVLDNLVESFQFEVFPTTQYVVGVASVCTNIATAPLNITFTTNSFCKKSKVIALVSKTSDTITVNWDAVVGIMQYRISVRNTQTNVTTTIDTIDLNYTITGILTSNTLYEIKLASVCGGNISVYTPSIMVTTDI